MKPLTLALALLILPCAASVHAEGDVDKINGSIQIKNGERAGGAGQGQQGDGDGQAFHADSPLSGVRAFGCARVREGLGLVVHASAGAAWRAPKCGREWPRVDRPDAIPEASPTGFPGRRGRGRSRLVLGFG